MSDNNTFFLNNSNFSPTNNQKGHESRLACYKNNPFIIFEQIDTDEKQPCTASKSVAAFNLESTKANIKQQDSGTAGAAFSVVTGVDEKTSGCCVKTWCRF